MQNAIQGRRSGRGTIRAVVEAAERRQLLAAHVVGSAVAYGTIQAAVDAAPAGGTVTVDAGTYAEQVTIAKPLTVLGARTGVDARSSGRPTATASTESVVVGAVSAGVHSSAFHVLANDVTIDGFTVTGETNPDDQLGAGIVVGPQQSGTHVTDDVVRGNVSGLFLANDSSADAALIQHCYFGSNNNDGDNGGRGIYTDGTVSGGNLTDVTIDANTFANNLGGDGTTGLEAALAFEAGNPGEQSAIRITNNGFTGNGKAVLFFNATNVLIQGNTVTNCQDQYSGSLRFEGDNNNVQILYNTVTGNTGPAVAVDSKGMPGDNYAFVINYNNFGGNNYAYSVPISVANNFDTYDGTFDARYNYWGSPTGPSGWGTGSGDAAGGGYMQIGTGLGWTLTTGGGTMTLAPWSTAKIAAPGSVPAAPTGLAATATSAAQVNLTWTDNAAGNETGFVVQRSTDGVTFAQIGTTAAGVTTYADTAGLVAGATYSYRVAAVNATGTSTPSNVATATPAAVAGTTYLSDLAWTSATAGWGAATRDATVKGNPITLRGTVYAKGIGTHAASAIVYALNGAYATFTSDVGVDDETAGQGAVDFQVLGDGKLLYDSGVLTGTSAAGHVSVSVAGVTTLTLVATNGVAGSIDYDHADWAGARLTTAAATPTPTVPAAPTGLTAVATSASQVTLAWAAGGTTHAGFAVDRSADGGVTYATIGTAAGTALTYADATVAAGTAYTYRVRATNAAGTSTPSNAAAVTTPAATVPAAPTTLTATAASASQVTLTWTAGGPSQTGFAVDRSADAGVTYATVATVAGTVSTYADATVAAGTAYTYRVRATNAVGTSLPSNTAAVTTPAATATPVSLTTLTPTSATVGWGTLHTNASIKGNPITLRKAAYPLGLGAHASSTIVYALAGKYATFTTDAGVDDETAGLGAVDFQVLGDGKLLYDSGVLTGTSPVAHVSVSVAGVQVLTLLATPGVAGTIDYDHADWAGPLLTPAPASQAVAVVRTGTAIGTAGSYGSAGNTIAKALDGNLATFFDAPTADGDWVGLDLGTAQSVSQISFAPRSGYASRMVGGVFQASTTADFSSGVTTLYTIAAAPASGSLTTVTLTTPVTARYFRYLGPAGGYGNVAEVAFAG